MSEIRTEYVADGEIYRRGLLELVSGARRNLWLATADLKDVYVAANRRGGMKPLLQTLAELLGRGVEIRLIHAKEPGPNFRADFDRWPILATGLERVLCPRMHFKCVVADCERAYFGSANLTGAGMGAKSGGRRNFENGVLTNDPALVGPLLEHFDSLWRGDRCADCRRKAFCADGPAGELDV